MGAERNARIGWILVVLAACDSSLEAFGLDGGVDSAEPAASSDAAHDSGALTGDTATTDGAEVPLRPPLAVTRLDPAYGTAGTVLRVEGGPFPADATFTVQGQPAQIVSFEVDAVEVALPELSFDGLTRLTVTAPRHEPNVEGQPLRYFTTAEGGRGAVGLVARVAHAGTYWPDDVENEGFAEVAFPVGPAPHYGAWRYAAEIDTCQRDRPVLTLPTYDLELESLAIVADDDTEARNTLSPATLEGDTAGYRLSEVPLEAILPTAHALETDGAADTWPRLDVADFVGAPDFNVAMADPQISGTRKPRLDREGHLLWGAPFTGEILVRLERRRFNPTTEEFLPQEVVTCWLVDDGVHTIGDLWTDWAPLESGPAYDEIEIRFGRVYAPEAVLPHNRGTSGVLGGTFILGLAVAE